MTLGFEDVVRYEHHITEAYKSIVRQPYLRRAELVEIADHVANISAKHEGGDPEIDQTRAHPSDILDYFRDRKEIVDSGDWENLTLNFLDKYEAANRTAMGADRGGAVLCGRQDTCTCRRGRAPDRNRQPRSRARLLRVPLR